MQNNENKIFSYIRKRNNLRTFYFIEREHAAVIKFCQIALAAPSIVETEKQALIQQRNQRQQIKTSPTFVNFTK